MIYNDEHIAFLRKHETMPRRKLAVIFNEKFDTSLGYLAIHGKCNRLGLKVGRSACFKKGHIPWNAGTKGQGLTGSNKTSFKKGHVPANHKPVGSQRIDSKDGYVIEKTVSGKWQHKQRIVWEENFGAIPSDKIVGFKDGDVLNCSPENLELMTREENLYLNNCDYKNAALEVKPAMLGIAKIDIKLRELSKKQKEEVVDA